MDTAAVMAEEARTEALARTVRALARRGFRFLPLWFPRADGACGCGVASCKSPGKHPFERFVPRGKDDATTDPAVIDRWLAVRPALNMGVVPVGRVLILDVDGEAGMDRWVQLCGRLGIPETFHVKTANGWHFWFTWPESGGPMPRGTFLGYVARWPGAGYVLAPYSRHPSGATYMPLVKRFVVTPIPSAWIVEARGYRPVRKTPHGVELVMHEGERHDGLLRIGGALRRLGVGREALEVALTAVDRYHAVPPKGADEIRALVADIVDRYVPAPAGIHFDVPDEELTAAERALARRGRRYAP